MIEKAEHGLQVDSTRQEGALDRRSFLIAISAALSLRFANTLQADEDDMETEEPQTAMLLDSESARFLEEHGILQEWYAVAEEVQKLSLRDEESETTISVPPKLLTPDMIAEVREDYLEGGHLVCDDGSFAFRLNIAVPTVRGRMSFARGHVDVQMLVSRERIVTVEADDNDMIVGSRIYQEQSEYVPFRISVIDATGREVGTADANRRNIASLDLRKTDFEQPLTIKFLPCKPQRDI